MRSLRIKWPESPRLRALQVYTRLEAKKKAASKKNNTDEVERLEAELKTVPRGALHRPMDELQWLQVGAAAAVVDAVATCCGSCFEWKKS